MTAAGRPKRSADEESEPDEVCRFRVFSELGKRFALLRHQGRRSMLSGSPVASDLYSA
jgi:hypothetical protein